MYGHIEGGVGTCMDTQRGWGGYMYGHREGGVGTGMDT